MPGVGVRLGSVSGLPAAVAPPGSASDLPGVGVRLGSISDLPAAGAPTDSTSDLSCPRAPLPDALSCDVLGRESGR
ncbi:hypothetical protein AB0K16_36805 [Nonomuraea jabiensis]|uniref:hypothetical protein n=1 Tax=Nonomuraea jabiensis TaxID=882448 RepID=UPI00343D286A